MNIVFMKAAAVNITFMLLYPALYWMPSICSAWFLTSFLLRNIMV